MERKKLLIVAVSVGVVLLIIIGIPLLMIAPRQNMASSSILAEQDWVTAVEPGIQRGQLPAAAIEPAVEPEAYANSVPAVENTFSQPAESSQLTLTVPIPEAAAVPHTTVTQAQKPAAVKLSPEVKPASAAQTASTKPPAAKPVSAAPSAPKEAAKPPAAKPADTAKTYNNYWVQTGAFSTMVRAEGVKESLATKGITSIIDNRDIDGKTWYRVRVGPYMSETEANYWLALVKSIDGFADSQIRLTQVLR